MNIAKCWLNFDNIFNIKHYVRKCVVIWYRPLWYSKPPTNAQGFVWCLQEGCHCLSQYLHGFMSPYWATMSYFHCEFDMAAINEYHVPYNRRKVLQLATLLDTTPSKYILIRQTITWAMHWSNLLSANKLMYDSMNIVFQATNARSCIKKL